MANKPTSIALAGAASLLLACSPPFYANIEEPSLTVTQKVGPVPGLPSVSVPSGLLFPPFTFVVGDIGVSQASSDSKVWLNGATLAMVSPGPGTSFAGVTSASLSIAPPAGSALQEIVVADFDAARDGAATTTLVLKGTGQENLLPYLEAQQFTVRVGVAGAPPGPVNTTWSADLALDFHVLAQKNLP